MICSFRGGRDAVWIRALGGGSNFVYV